MEKSRATLNHPARKWELKTLNRAQNFQRQFTLAEVCAAIQFQSASSGGSTMTPFTFSE
jgi:hypothetical protein